MKRVRAVLLLSGLALTAILSADDRIWDDRPADGNWENSWYPIGNGETGCMLDGGTDVFRVQVNADALWTGGTTVSDIVEDSRCFELNAAFGDYQALGRLELVIPRMGGLSDYRRELDLAKSEYRDSFKATGAGDDHVEMAFVRRAFASRADRLVAIRIEAVSEFSLPVRIRLFGAHGKKDVTENGFTGVLPNGLGYRVSVCRIDEPKCVTVLLKARTTYDSHRHNFGLVGAPPQEEPFDEVDFVRLFERHLAEYSQYWNRLAFELSGDPVVTNLTTRERMTRAAFPKSLGFAYRTSANPFGGGAFKWHFGGDPAAFIGIDMTKIGKG